MAISISTDPSQRVEEEFVSRLDPLGPAPDADDQIHRDQAAFEEDVEQQQVLRGEHADHQRLHDQEGGHIFGYALSIAFQLAPMQIGIRNRVSMISISAMPSMPIAQATAAAELVMFDELPLRAAGSKAAPQPDADAEADQRGDQRVPARAVGRLEQRQHAGDQRQRDQDRQDRHRLIAPTRTPRSRRRSGRAA